MGLTKRKDSFYVEFRVIDNGKALELAPGVQGAKLKRWKVGCTNRTTAKQHEAILKSKLLSGTIPSDRVHCPSTTFGQWAEVYKAIEQYGQSEPIGNAANGSIGPSCHSLGLTNLYKTLR